MGDMFTYALGRVGEYDTALALYNELLKEHPTNLAVMKRKVRATCCCQ